MSNNKKKNRKNNTPDKDRAAKQNKNTKADSLKTQKPGEETKTSAEDDSVKDEFVAPDEEEILEIKEARIKDFDKKEEVELKSRDWPDTPWFNFLRKLEFFWEYYKWFVIIPVIVITIIVIFVTTYIDENSEKSLEVSIMNTSNVFDAIAAIEKDYPAETGIEADKYPIRVEYNFSYPNNIEMAAKVDDSSMASMTKFNTMVMAGRVDVVFTSPWVADIYSESDATKDLREIFDEEFLKEHESRIYRYIADDYNEIPVGFYVDDCEFLGEFTDDIPPVMASFDSATHPDAVKPFMEWVLSKCTEGSDYVKKQTPDESASE